MKIYADAPSKRLSQLVQDIAVVVWIYVWVWLAVKIHDLVASLATPGRKLEGAGSGFASTLDDAAASAREVPLVGDGLASPLGAAADAGRVLRDAGVSHQEIVLDLALWLSLAIALIPTLLMLIRYLPGRITWVREASAAQTFMRTVDLRLFALRAVATAPLHSLRRASEDPLASLDRNEHHRLAAIELERLGLRAPARAEPAAEPGT